MNKVKLYGLLSIVLLIINISLIWFLVANNLNQKRGEAPKRFIIEKLHFDSSQVQAYDKLIKWHRENINAADAKVKTLKEELYVCLQAEDKSAMADSLMQEIGKEKVHIEQIHYQHFIDIKKLCKANQLNDFNGMTTELARLFAPHPRRDEKN